MKLDHIDDVKTKWFKCEHCGAFTCSPKASMLEAEDADCFCEFCSKFHTEQCKFKDDSAPPNKDSKGCTEYVEKEVRPKIRDRCGTCAAFHTPFCTREYKDMEIPEAYKVNAQDYACSLFFHRLKFLHKRSAEKFRRRVEDL